MQKVDGVLYVIATPIGNLGDISARALETLETVNRVYAEDTRHTRRLLSHFGIKAQVVSLHEHNESERVSGILEYLKDGNQVALVSDAGTPLISDPGYRLVAECHSRGLRVSPVPGPSALIAALSVCGLPTDRFLFLGFPPARSEMRRNWMQEFASYERTMVFYESKHRIASCLADMVHIFGADREVALIRELTKQFETVTRGPTSQLLELIRADANQQKGEFVLVVEGASQVNGDEDRLRHLLDLLMRDLSLKRSAEVAASITGQKKNRVYKMALEISSQCD